MQKFLVQFIVRMVEEHAQAAPVVVDPPPKPGPTPPGLSPYSERRINFEVVVGNVTDLVQFIVRMVEEHAQAAPVVVDPPPKPGPTPPGLSPCKD